MAYAFSFYGLMIMIAVFIEIPSSSRLKIKEGTAGRAFRPAQGLPLWPELI